MFICRGLTGAIVLTFLLGCTPVNGQDGQKDQKKTQTTATNSAVRVSRPVRVRFGGFTFGAGYSRYSGPWSYYYLHPYSYYWPWYYDAFYPSFSGIYSPLWYHPGWYTGFARQSGMGEVRLHSNLQDADVFINDGLAGKTKDLKTMWLEPGAYDLKVQADKYSTFTIRIYVLSDKTLTVNASLAPQKEP